MVAGRAVTLFYADTSAIVRGYLADKKSDARLPTILFAGEHPVVTSELTRVEFASAIAAALRSGRLADAQPVLNQFDHDCSPDGPIALLPLQTSALSAARRLVITGPPLRTLDALHIAVALHDAAELAGDAPVTFLTRDNRQATAARAAGLEIG